MSGRRFRGASERSGENTGALARLQGPDGRLEFLHHVTGRKLAQIAAIAFAIGVAFGGLGEGDAALQVRQGSLDAGLGLFLGLLLVHMLHDVGRVEHFRQEKVLAGDPVEGLDLLGAGLRRAFHHLARQALHAQAVLDDLPDAGVTGGAAPASILLDPRHLLRDQSGIDGPRIAGRRLRE